MKTENQIIELLNLRITERNACLECGLVRQMCEIDHQIDDIRWILDMD